MSTAFRFALASFALAPIALAAIGGAPPRFPNAMTVAAGKIRSVTVGDVNGDARPDVALAFETQPGIAIEIGAGGGRFQPGPTIGSAPASGVALGDLNGDGKLDLIVAQNTPAPGGDIARALGDGAGGFGPLVGIAPANSVWEKPLIADFDGDGKADVALLKSGTGSITVLRGDGAGGVTGATTLGPVPGGSNFLALAAADLNGDGRRDLVAGAKSPGALVIFAANADGTFQPAAVQPLSAALFAIALGDVDLDLDLDVAVALSSDEVHLFRNDGAAGLTFANALVGGGFTADAFLGFADLDLDGRADLVLQRPSSIWPASHGLQLAHRRGHGDFDFEAMQVRPAGGTVVALADADADGAADAIAVDGSGLVVTRGDGYGSFVTTDVKGGADPTLIGPSTAGDLDGDGRDDVATSYALGLALLESQGAASGFTQKLVSLPGSFIATNDLAIADFQGDGANDVLKANTSASLFILRNDGAGGVASIKAAALPAAALDVATGDLDGDGDVDCVAATEPTATVLLNGGAGAIGAAGTIAPAGKARRAALGDVDLDGDLDLALSVAANDLASGWIEIHANDGHAQFAPAAATAPDAAVPGSLDLADFDGDSDVDVVAIAGSAGIRLWYRQLDGSYAAPMLLATEAAVDLLQVSDLDSDGRDDLAFEMYAADRVGVAWGDGLGSFEPIDRHPRPAAAFAIADADGDGAADLVFSDSDLPLLLNRGHDGYAFTYATGCPGNGGVVPELALAGVPAIGGPIGLRIHRGPGGGTAFLFAGTGQGTLVLNGGCPLAIAPIVPGFLLPLPLAGAGAGTGTFAFDTVIPPTFFPSTFTLQAVIPDASGPGGKAATRAVRLTILP